MIRPAPSQTGLRRQIAEPVLKKDKAYGHLPTLPPPQANGGYGSTPPVQPRSRERPLSALCSRWLTTRRMGEDAPKPT
jgi:hypothetical protein